MFHDITGNSTQLPLTVTIRNRPLTGLEIHATRKHGNAGATNRCGRSKYTPGKDKRAS